ncbi:hypothetical protein KIPB_000223 [Kipferlia bialata]|uniref:Uncharacterized protein n=1 Tax=Kipferlia bialata TaxID=797122 RepID=A0A9K3CLR9_9EUKA|nr:hypothetical protein KIPB_000223 [Kipferlia bialata]|eukprot:g223.t1
MDNVYELERLPMTSTRDDVLMRIGTMTWVSRVVSLALAYDNNDVVSRVRAKYDTELESNEANIDKMRGKLRPLVSSIRCAMYYCCYPDFEGFPDCMHISQTDYLGDPSASCREFLHPALTRYAHGTLSTWKRDKEAIDKVTRHYYRLCSLGEVPEWYHQFSSATNYEDLVAPVRHYVAEGSFFLHYLWLQVQNLQEERDGEARTRNARVLRCLGDSWEVASVILRLKETVTLCANSQGSPDGSLGLQPGDITGNRPFVYRVGERIYTVTPEQYRWADNEAFLKEVFSPEDEDTESESESGSGSGSDSDSEKNLSEPEDASDSSPPLYYYYDNEDIPGRNIDRSDTVQCQPAARSDSSDTRQPCTLGCSVMPAAAQKRQFTEMSMEGSDEEGDDTALACRSPSEKRDAEGVTPVDHERDRVEREPSNYQSHQTLTTEADGHLSILCDTEKHDSKTAMERAEEAESAAHSLWASLGTQRGENGRLIVQNTQLRQDRDGAVERLQEAGRLLEQEKAVVRKLRKDQGEDIVAFEELQDLCKSLKHDRDAAVARAERAESSRLADRDAAIHALKSRCTFLEEMGDAALEDAANTKRKLHKTKGQLDEMHDQYTRILGKYEALQKSSKVSAANAAAELARYKRKVKNMEDEERWRLEREQKKKRQEQERRQARLDETGRNLMEPLSEEETVDEEDIE